jgi:NAD(P)-dependent dehydrogenase (short-subunit alcohol dehydrogenase family)
MQGKIVAVTGASGALGWVVTGLALERGAKVALIDHSATKTSPTENRFEIGGVDLSEAGEAKRAIDTAATHFGGLDVLVNVAGAFSFQTVADGDTALWERLYRLNTLTALNTSRAAIPHLVKSKSGRIINIGAMGALHAGSGMGPYAASKSGVHRLTETLAEELKGKVTVNAVMPSTIDTPANRRDMPNADFSKWATPHEVAAMILFLASDESSGVTGALIPVAGRV